MYPGRVIRIPKFSGLLLFLSVLAACSGSDADDPNATVFKFCSNWGKAACGSAAVTACSGVEKATETLTDACIESQRAFCIESLPSTGYSSERADECLDAVEQAYRDGRLSALEVDTVRHRGAPCNHLVKGPVGKGGECDRTDECDTVQGYSCILKSGKGSCQIPNVVPNGTSCAAPGAACNTGFYCDERNCVQSGAVGDPCEADFECTTGLACDPDSSECVARVSQTKCTKDDDCTTNVCSIPVTDSSDDTPSVGRCVDYVILAPTEGLCQDLGIE